MKITRIARQRRHTDRLNIHLDGERRLVVPEELATRMELRVGRVLDETELAAIDGESAAWRAKEAALLLLSYRPRTEQELRRRLARRTFTPAVIDDCVQRLARAGLLDDDAYARSFVRERLRNRPSGAPRLLAELRARGVAAATAHAAIEAALDEEPESEIDLARRAAARFRRRRGEESLRARRRLYGFLSRRGFGAETIRALIHELID